MNYSDFETMFSSLRTEGRRHAEEALRLFRVAHGNEQPQPDDPTEHDELMQAAQLELGRCRGNQEATRMIEAHLLSILNGKAQRRFDNNPFPPRKDTIL